MASVRIEASRRLVEEQRVGITSERDRHVESPLLSTRQSEDSCVSLVGQAHELEHLSDITGMRVVAGIHRHGLCNREVAVDSCRLQDDADSFLQL